VSDAFIREVDEDLRQKQLLNFWKTYGKFIIGIAVGIVVLVAGRAIYFSSIESKYGAQATAFSNALKLEKEASLAALAPLSESGVDGYEILAAFKSAELLLGGGDQAGAVKILDQFINSSSTDQMYKDIAAIQAVLILIDTAPLDEIKKRLSLIQAGDTELKYLAEELIALSELKTGEADAAKTRLLNLTQNLEVPEQIKSRAQQYLSVIE
jgi:hypothetical protein